MVAESRSRLVGRSKTYNSRKRKLSHEEVSVVLVPPNFPQRKSPWSVAPFLSLRYRIASYQCLGKPS